MATLDASVIQGLLSFESCAWTNVLVSFLIHKGFTVVMSHVWIFFRSILESLAGRHNIPDLWIKILLERTKKDGLKSQSTSNALKNFTRGKPGTPLRMLDYGGIPAVVGRA